MSVLSSTIFAGLSSLFALNLSGSATWEWSGGRQPAELPAAQVITACSAGVWQWQPLYTFNRFSLFINCQAIARRGTYCWLVAETILCIPISALDWKPAVDAALMELWGEKLSDCIMGFVGPSSSSSVDFILQTEEGCIWWAIKNGWSSVGWW